MKTDGVSGYVITLQRDISATIYTIIDKTFCDCIESSSTPNPSGAYKLTNIRYNKKVSRMRCLDNANIQEQIYTNEIMTNAKINMNLTSR